ncbi:hypothetical protein E2986_12886 [Frieseomelitta varia]|uniref:Uncharacterized protein n=1 Tax=Frieseomelitta varia TaxID=561572 RepID=A0A833VYU1_9HYME|nr:hypothetical protein E2986_12886 [Frieseomelitta varia]
MNSRACCNESTNGRAQRRRRRIDPGTRSTWSFVDRACLYIRTKNHTRQRLINRTRESLL